MKNYLCIVFLSATLCGCSSTLKDLPPLEGTWQRETRRGHAYEAWTISKPGLMLGRGYEVGSKGDTTQLESLRLFVEGGTIIYEATVADQNGGKSIAFPMVEESPKQGQFSFENLSHDFPQRIVYRLVTDDSLHVRLEDRGGKGFELHFRRME